MRLLSMSLCLLLGMPSCQNTGHGSCPSPSIEFRVTEKSSDNPIWKQYSLRSQECSVDIPGTYAEPPYVLEYENQPILVCPLKRGGEHFLVCQTDDRLAFAPLTETIDFQLLMDRCRAMHCDPLRLVNGTLLQVKEGRLLSNYTVECFHRTSHGPGALHYLEFTVVLDIDWDKRTLQVKEIIAPSGTTDTLQHSR